MNQGKLEVVKQEMARVNVNILGISELKLSGMGEFNSESEGELKSLLMKVKEESQKVGLSSTFRKQRSWHPVPSVQ